MKNKHISAAQRYVKDGILELHDMVKVQLPVGTQYTKGKSKYEILDYGLPFGDNPRVKVVNIYSGIQKWIYIFPHIID